MNRSLAGALAAAFVLLTAAAASAAALPDLEVNYISAPPSALQPGDQFTVTARVANLGGAKAGKSTARFYISQDKLLAEPEAV
ncbi:MAG TPA: CARDB domain-containing protein, partial [Longimicrobium sp.]|nr:CARDB domain-containing protein [Longimicrobium sp.]